MRTFAGMIVACLINTPAAAQESVALLASPGTIGRAEAVTSTVRGTDALFYNPAGLAHSSANLQLLGAENISGIDTRKVAAYSATDQEDPLDTFLDTLNSQETIYQATTLRAADIAFPYVALTSFAGIDTTGRGSESDGTFGLDVKTDIGLAGGLAVKWKKLALGYSRFSLVRGEIMGSATEEQIAALKEALENHDEPTTTAIAREVTTVRYGGATGENYGLLYTWWEENPSGIGISVLNAGDVKFSPNAQTNNKSVRQYEATLQEGAETYGIAIDKPEPIPQIVNVGVNLGFGDANSYFFGAVSADGHDIGGTTIPVENRLSASYEFGLRLSNPLTLALSWPILDSDWIAYAQGLEKPKHSYFIHMGVLSLKAFGGYRQNSYTVHGGAASFHFGINRILSLLRVDIEGFRLKPLHESGETPSAGVKASLALTLVL